jgi:hypothetical protein
LGKHVLVGQHRPDNSYISAGVLELAVKQDYAAAAEKSTIDDRSHSSGVQAVLPGPALQVIKACSNSLKGNLGN